MADPKEYVVNDKTNTVHEIVVVDGESLPKCMSSKRQNLEVMTLDIENTEYRKCRKCWPRTSIRHRAYWKID